MKRKATADEISKIFSLIAIKEGYIYFNVTLIRRTSIQ